MDQPLTLDHLRKFYSQGGRPETIVRQIYARLRELGDDAIFIDLLPEDAVIEMVGNLGTFDAKRSLWGVPFAAKDNIDVAGLPTTAACPDFAYNPGEDAFVISTLKAAGAFVIGKTNLDQFATGLVGVRSPYGVPRNALDAEYVPGGSSSGSAVAVAQGIVSFALGTDTAGSGRVPAALNGIVGLKPTLGQLSGRGVVPACRSVETVSIFALTVEDAEKVYQTARGPDAGDPYSRSVADAGLFRGAGNVRLAVPDRDSIVFLGDGTQERAYRDVLENLAAAGVVITEIDFSPFYEAARLLYEGPWIAERHIVVDEILRNRPEAILPVTRGIIESALRFTATDTFRAIYRLKDIAHEMTPIIVGFDALCVPTIPTLFTLTQVERDPVTTNSRFGTYTNFVNLLDLCAIAVPTGKRADGFPMSVTFVGAAGTDGLMARIAQIVEGRSLPQLAATGWTRDTGGASNPRPVAEEHVALAVCGAHMSGLPLNRDIVDRGGVFVRSARTSSAYRIYALPDDGVKRPGLVRGDSGSGGEVELEIWLLTKDALAEILIGIPRPLGLGKIELSDGGTVTGFLCEAQGIVGAQDITAYGGWRAFCNEAGWATQSGRDHGKGVSM